MIAIFFSLKVFSQENGRLIKITQIDSTESNYFIKGVFKTKPKNKFLIISKKEQPLILCKRIEINNIYRVLLSDYLDEKTISNLPPVLKAGTFLLREDDYIIWDGYSDLPYTSSNIKSLCYIDSPDG